MNKKVLHTLEYDKILGKLSSFTQTTMGKQAVEQLQPLKDVQQIKHRLQKTDEAMRYECVKGAPSFENIVNIIHIIQRASLGSTLQSQELFLVLNTLSGMRYVKKQICAVHNKYAIPILHNLSALLSDQQPLEQHLTDCIGKSGEIVDQASVDLAKIRSAIRTEQARVKDRLDGMIRSSTVAKMLQEQLITIRNERFVIPVKEQYRSHFGGIVHDQSASGATLFIEPQSIVTMNNKIKQYRLQEQKEVEVILQKLTALVAQQQEQLLQDHKVICELDVSFAKGRLAVQMKATCPIVNDSSIIKLIKARHPLIEATKVVPVDVELGQQHTSIVITGPNTGGKTVTLKTVGLLSLMSMTGLFIPAEPKSEMCVFDHIFADIGDEQSIEQSLSTFSSHMTNIIQMVHQITPKSLVLLDELGAGTDPTEGSALAISILEHMHKAGCIMVATTHYSELKAYAYERQGMINASMEFDIQTLSPTYRLLIGIPGSSNALAIAQRLGMPPSLLHYARAEMKEQNQRVEQMILSLEQSRRTAEQNEEDVKQLRVKLEQLQLEYEQKLNKLEQKKQKKLQKAEDEARLIVKKAKEESERVIAELRKLALEQKGSVKEHKLIAARKQLEDAQPVSSKENETIFPSHGRQSVQQTVNMGDEVYVNRFNQIGHVVELLSNNEAVVQMGRLKMKLPLTDLQRKRAEPNEKRTKSLTKTTLIKRAVPDSVSSEIHLRGLDLEQALIEIDRFMDKAILNHLNTVYIVHGKGKGILRAGIHQYLNKNKHVKNYRLGNYGEGDYGVTVVEL